MENWRTDTDAEDYLRRQQKRLALDVRRPVIRRASDLVGPGLASTAVRVTNFNDALATFNGYFSSMPGALNAPNTTESFVGTTATDADFGGFQKLTAMTSGAEYKRVFRRNPADPETVVFDAWTGNLPDVDWTDVVFRAGSAWANFDARKVQYCRSGGWVHHRGLAMNGGNTVIFTNPPGFRPEARVANEHHFPAISNSAFALLAADNAGRVTLLSGSDAWVDVSTVTYKAAF